MFTEFIDLEVDSVNLNREQFFVDDNGEKLERKYKFPFHFISFYFYFA